MNLRIRERINDKPARDSSSGDMHLIIPPLIAQVSKSMTLEPGDLIPTGTPQHQPDSVALPLPLQLADTLDAEIEMLGKLRNEVGDGPSK